ncbi:MAG TPA: hypothetical protein DHW82_08720 [Spirochaetia bacterium]|nr:MAG: hypothetical protein A2Y41_05075 [Spirochaetes bacterium GWB1_36_13]HCL57073.1 hypothetical protein [Spirochaetia bacterium]
MRLKRVALLFFLSLVICSSFVSAEQYDQKEAEIEIDNASKAIAEALSDPKTRDFLPFLFGESKKYYEEARYYLEEEEFDWSVYFSKMSQIMAQASLYRAKAELLKWQLRDEEIKKWKKTATAGEKGNLYQEKIKALEQEFLEAKLNLLMAENKMEKMGRVYILTINDKDLFISGTYAISDNGQAVLDKVLQVLSLVPQSKITVEGHTAKADKDNNATIKANSVKDYLVRRSKNPLENIWITAYGNQKPLVINNKVLRGPENDRIVIVFELPEKIHE